MSNKQRWSQPRRGVLASTISMILGGAAIGGTAAAQEQEGQDGLEEIVVTGSRIVRRDFTAASPIMTVGEEQFQNISTVGVEAALNQLPQFVPGSGTGGPGAGTQFGTTDVQSTASNSPGISVLNLRGLGPNRNLVLINGRRAQPANASLVIDVNTIPAAAIETVEVITGGASAVYGADAIGGVVNFRLRDDFEGVAFDYQTSGTDQGGGEESRFSALLGGNFDGGRGNAMVGMEWAKRNPVHELDREFTRRQLTDPGTPGGVPLNYSRFQIAGFNLPSQAAVDQVWADAGFPGINMNPATEFYFNDDGTIFVDEGALNYRGPLAPQDLRYKIESDGDLNETFTDNWISSPLERYSVFARSTYDITDNVRGFVQGNFTSVEVKQVLGYSPSFLAWGGNIPNDGRFVPPALQTLLDARPDPTATWALARNLDFIGPRRSENRNRMMQVMTGIEGEIGNTDWTYEAYFSHGETSIKNRLGGFASTERFRQVVQAPNWGAGLSAGNSFLGFQATCTTGLPIFERFTPSQDCLDAMTINMTNTTEMDQDIFEANFQGRITDMPAGELRGAIGVSGRKNTVQFTPDQNNDAENGVDLPVGLFAANDTGGSTDVSEIYGELLIPLTSSFNLELGIRSSDYNTTGRLETYKALFDWGATDSIRFRGGRQVANRAPNIAELFQGRTQLVVGFFYSDPCTAATIAPWGNIPSNPNRAQTQALCSAIINAPPGMPSDFDLDPDNYRANNFFPLELDSRVGNPLVKNEEAETYTLGMVWTGEAWTAAVDWYSVEITNAIAPLAATTVYEQCFNADGTTNPTYSIDDPSGLCRTIVRSPTSGGRLAVNTQPVNFGGIKTSGVDVQLNWRKDIGPGNLFLNLVVNYLNEYSTQDTPTAPFRDSVGTLDQGGQFDYRIFANLTYSAGDWSVGTRLRHLPSADDQSIVQNPATTILGVDSYSLVDVFGSYQINDQLNLRAGIDNLFDPDPEVVGENPGFTNAISTTNAGFYDILGRRYWLGVNFGF